MARTTTLNKRLRFEVFKRDKFVCQYCGRRAPDVVLQADHVVAVANGGTDEMLNLVTSCFDCNNGKGARALDDHSVLLRQTEELAALAERHEQLEMLMEWRRGLVDFGQARIEALALHFSRLTGHVVPDSEKTAIGKLFAKRPPCSEREVLDAMETAVSVYLKRGEDGKATPESVEKALQAIGGIVAVSRKSVEKPYLPDLFYARGILRNRKLYINEKIVMGLMEAAASAGVDVEDIKNAAKDARSWTAFRERLLELEAKLPR